MRTPGHIPYPISRSRIVPSWVPDRTFAASINFLCLLFSFASLVAVYLSLGISISHQTAIAISERISSLAGPALVAPGCGGFSDRLYLWLEQTCWPAVRLEPLFGELDEIRAIE